MSSTKFLKNKIIDEIIKHDHNNIMELGAGNGVFTNAICELSYSKFIVVEKNMNYEKNLNQLKNKVKIYYSCFNDIKDRELPNNQFNIILSSIPIALFNQEEKKRFFENIHNYLSPNGIFIQYQYLPTDIINYQVYFRSYKILFELRNLPPAFIYVCKK